MDKIKIGIHQHVFTSKLNEDNLDILDFIREIGYESVDINLRNTAFEFTGTMKKRAERLGLFLTGGGSLPKDKELISKDKEKRIEAVEYMKKLVRKASEIGISLYHGLIYATAGVFTGRGPTEEEFEYAVTGLKEVANYAGDYGVSLCLEPANRYENYLINTVKDSLKMLDAINEPNVGLLLDSYHMNIEEKDIYKSIVSAKFRVLHFHVNENDRGIPGTGHIPWDDVFKALRDIDYRGTVTVESFVDSTIDIAPIVGVWRKLAPDAETLSRQSYKFIKKMSKKYSLM